QALSGLYSRIGKIPPCGCDAADVFDFFHSAGLARPRQRHHCLTALRRDGRSLPQSDARPGEAKRPMYKLYSMQRSGNSYKVRLALALLDASYRAIEIDI